MLICDSLGDTVCWTTVWTGVTAVATLALLVAAIFAGLNAYWLLKNEIDRDIRAERSERSSQASLVAAWPKNDGVSSVIGPEGQGIPALVICAYVRNASQLPIYDVVVSWEVTEVSGERIIKGEFRAPSHAPDAEANVRFPNTAVRVVIPDHSEQAQWAGLSAVRTSIAFRDTAGIPWRRGFDGVLNADLLVPEGQ